MIFSISNRAFTFRILRHGDRMGHKVGVQNSIGVNIAFNRQFVFFTAG
jgi:hypothetical protein